MNVMVTLFAICVIDVLGFGIMVPLVPYMAHRFGASPALITPILGIYSLCQLLASPLLGRLSDRFGRRPVLIASMSMGAISYLLLGYATSLTWLMVARALNGLMAGSIVTVMAYATDISKPAERARALGTMGAAVGVGFMLGPAIGGVLAGDNVQTANYAAPALLAAGMALVAMSLVIFRLPESLTVEQRVAHAAERSPAHPMLLLATHPGLLWLTVAGLLMTFAAATVESIYAVWAFNRFGVGPRTTGLSLLGIAFVSVAVQGGLVRRLVPRFGEYRVAFAGIAAYVGGLLIVALGRSVGSAFCGLTLLGAGSGAYNPCGSALASRQAEAGNRGAVMGVYQAGTSLARVIGPLTAGSLYSRFGPGAPYLVGAVVVAQAVWCVAMARRHPGSG